MYPEVSLYIDGAWTKGANGKFLQVLNPATGEEIGKVAHAEKPDLDRALAAADKGFKAWKKASPYDRYKVLRKADAIIRGRPDETGTILSMEQAQTSNEDKGATLPAGELKWGST